MSKVVVIPDPHTKIDVIERGLKIADALRAEHIVLLGDYFDDWEATAEDNIKMLKYIKNLLKTRVDVVALLGNHELSYLGFPCSGHIKGSAEKIKAGLETDYRFLYTVAFDGVLYSHAGVTQAWIRDNNIMTENSIRYRLTPEAGADRLSHAISLVEKLGVFNQVGYARGGKTSAPSPMWADLKELINDQLQQVKQVVGHTPISNIECLGNCWFTDVFSNGNVCDEYLVVTDGEPAIINYEVLFGDGQGL